MTEIKIPLSKTKISVLLIGALAFVFFCSWGAIDPEKFVTNRYPETTILISSIAGILFFGLCSVFIVIKLFSSKPGLIINDEGITDNSNATSVGLIEWKDITGMKTMNVAKSKIIVIKTSKPKKYIDRSKNIISKKAMIANNKLYGSPLSIISNSLKIQFSELEKLIAAEMENNSKLLPSEDIE